MKPNLIVMLTHNDKTVRDAVQVFDSCADLPVKFWGIKDVGLNIDEMRRLVHGMKNKNKTTFLEIVTFDEKKAIELANLAVEFEFDYLMGPNFYPSLLNIVKPKGIHFFPFCGNVGGHPVVLKGTIHDILNEAKDIEKLGVDGFDLSAYRYIDGDPEELAKTLINNIEKAIVIAGSISSIDMVKKMKELKPWAFTIGSAFFDKRFVENGTFVEQVDKVISYLRG